MAQVPETPGMQVMPTIMGYRPMSDSIPKVPAMGIEQGLEKASNRIDRIFTKYLDEQDDARVTEALTSLQRKATDLQAGEGGWASQLGGNATMPDGEGRGLVERYDTALRSYGSELASKLTPRQQRKFGERAAVVYQSQYGATSQHVLQQSMKYGDDMQVAYANQAVEAGAINWDRPDALKRSVGAISEAAEKRASLNGWDKTVKDTYIREQTSKLFSNAITASLAGAEQNPYLARQANALLWAHSKNMLASDVARFRVTIDAYLARAAQNDTLNAVDKIALGKTAGAKDPTAVAATGGKEAPSVRAVRTAAMVEYGIFSTTGGLQAYSFDAGVGNEDNSRYGVGNLRVADAKETAEKHGMQFDVKKFTDDIGYSASIAQLRMGDLYSEYAGDEAKAFAAYFDKGLLDTAMKKAKADGKEAEWLSYLPKAAQDFTSSCVAAMKQADSRKSAGGRFSAFRSESAEDTYVGMTEKEIRQEVLRLDPRASYDVDYLESTVSRAVARENQRKQSWVSEHQTTMNQVSDILYRSGGDLGAIPVDLYSKLTSKDQYAAYELAKKINSGDDSTDQAIFNRYMSNDDLLRGLTEEALQGLRPSCSSSDWKLLQAKYYTLKGKWREAVDSAFAERQDQLQKLANGQLPADFASLFDYSKVEKQAIAHINGFVDLRKKDPAGAQLLINRLTKQLLFEYGKSGITSKDPITLEDEFVKLSKRLNVDVSTWFGWSSENRSLLTIRANDLPKSSQTDAWYMVDAATRNRVGHEPSDDERKETILMLALDPSYQPDFGILDAVTGKTEAGRVSWAADKDLWEGIRSRMEARGIPFTTRDVALSYITARLGGYSGARLKEEKGVTEDAPVISDPYAVSNDQLAF